MAPAESDSRIQTLLDRMPIGYHEVDTAGRIVRVNRAELELLGYAEHEVVGRPFWELSADPEESRRVLRARLDGTEPVGPVERRLRRSDGSVVTVLIDVGPLYEPDGRLAGLCGTIRDISARKRTEALADGERQILEHVAKGAPLPNVLERLVELVESQAPRWLGSILLVEDGVYLRHGAASSLPAAYNRAVDRIPIGPGVGSCGTAVYRRELVIAVDIATDPRWAAYRELALRHSLRCCWSMPVFGADGAVLGTFAIYGREPGAPSPADVQLIERAARLAATVIERTRIQEALRRSEAEYRAFFDDAPVGYYELSLDGRIVRANRTLLAMLGYTGTEVLGRYVWELSAEPELSRRSVVARLVGQEHLDWAERRYRHRSGEALWVLIENRPIYDRRGRVRGLRGAMLDITDRKRAEQQASAAAERLREQSQMLALLKERERIAMELHDGVIQSLFGLALELGALARVTKEGTTRERLQGVARRLADTIQDIRGYVTGLRGAELDLGGLRAGLEAIVAELRANGSLRAELDFDGDAAGDLDEARNANLLQIVREATANVLRHAHATSVTVGLRRADGAVELSIADDGCGFDPESATARPGHGLGNMAERARQVGGRLVVAAAPGQGTEVRVSIPVAGRPPSGPLPPPAHPKLPSPASSLARPAGTGSGARAPRPRRSTTAGGGVTR